MSKQIMKLYIVDPDRAYAERVEQTGREFGFETDHYAVPSTALGVIEDDKDMDSPFVVVVRSDMPGMSGAMFLRALKTGAAAAKPFKIILLGGAHDYEAVQAAVNIGVDRLLAGDASRSDLYNAFSECVDLVRADLAKKRRVEELVSLVSGKPGVASVFDHASAHGENVTSLAAHRADGGVLRVIDRPLKRGARPDLECKQDRLALIKMTQFVRRVRDRLIPACAEGDPSWEIFLYVMEQAELGSAVSVTAACHASAIPQTTAMRKIDELVAQGLLSRLPDPADRRRINLEPTELGIEQLHAFLQDALAYMRAMFGLPDTLPTADVVGADYSHAAE